MSFKKRILNYLVTIGVFLVILEPLWMLLPFAGFLYGSVLNLEFLKNSYYTIWLLYFIFPVQTLAPFAFILIFAGLAIFIAGAYKIYSAKIRKSGLVKTGVYKKFRHPQYTGLTLFAIGFVLLWGRFIAYIAFFLMMYLYYYLGKREERICLDLFGREYEDYMEKTYFLLPGEKIFSSVIGKPFSSLIPQKWARMIVSFVLLLSFGVIVCFSILSIRSSTMDVPFYKAKISDVAGNEIDLIMIKGPMKFIRTMDTKNDEEFFNALLSSFVSSAKVKQALIMIDTEKSNTLLCFLMSRKIKEKKSYFKRGRGDIFVILLDSPIKLKSDNLYDFRNNWNVLGAMEVNEFDMSGLSPRDEPVKGGIYIRKPYAGESYINFQKRMEGILNIHLYGLRKKFVRLDKIIEK